MRCCRILIFLLLFVAQQQGFSKVSPAQFGLTTIGDSTSDKQRLQSACDSVMAHHPMAGSKTVISGIEHPRASTSKTSDFYLLLCLCLTLGIIKSIDSRYFYNLWLAFWNPTLSSRQLKDQLQGAGWPNFLMNVFFAIAEGAYIYYVVRFFVPVHSGVIPPSLLLIMLTLGTGVIYIAKYAAVQFSGWAFRLQGVTEHYLFNVFLINKILGMVLVPFIIVLAFADHDVASQVMVISFVVCGALILNRYIRSWQVFGSFFQYSKFHFFMYLCASEILPLAVLMKLLVKGLMFY